VNNALRLENIPTIGPEGLATNTPERVHPITNADVYEVLRWMHADLKAIHRAFGHVADIRRDLEATRLLYHKQAAAVSKSVEQHEGIAEAERTLSLRVSEMGTQVGSHAVTLESLVRQNVELRESIDALTAQLKIPWWKRLIGRTS